MVKKSCAILVVLCSLVLLPVAAQGVVVNYNFPIDGTQAGTGSPGTGIGIVNYDTGTSLLDWNISWGGLLGTASNAHFHGPALPGFNAGVQVPLGVSSNPLVGNAVITAAQATDLQAGLWYVNIHSTQYGGGEIRGQVVPEPLSLTLFGLGSAALLGRRQRRNR